MSANSSAINSNATSSLLPQELQGPSNDLQDSLQDALLLQIEDALETLLETNGLTDDQQTQLATVDTTQANLSDNTQFDMTSQQLETNSVSA